MKRGSDGERAGGTCTREKRGETERGREGEEGERMIGDSAP